MDELKLCPFCEGTPILESSFSMYNLVAHATICCKSCCATVAASCFYSDSEVELICKTTNDHGKSLRDLLVEVAEERVANKWNRRAEGDGKRKWINVEEHLPEDSEYVLGYNDLIDAVEMCSLEEATERCKEGWYSFGGWHRSEGVITHWMPMPPKPGEEDSK